MVAHDAVVAGGFEEGRERLAAALLGCFGGEKAQGCGLFCSSSREEQEGKGLAPWVLVTAVPYCSACCFGGDEGALSKESSSLKREEDVRRRQEDLRERRGYFKGSWNTIIRLFFRKRVK
jgi:hypothetical protein